MEAVFDFAIIDVAPGSLCELYQQRRKNERFRSTTVPLSTLLVRTTTLCLPLKALFFISFNIDVKRSNTLAI